MPLYDDGYCLVRTHQTLWADYKVYQAQLNECLELLVVSLELGGLKIEELVQLEGVLQLEDMQRV